MEVANRNSQRAGLEFDRRDIQPLRLSLKPLAELFLPFSMNTWAFSGGFTANTHIGQSKPLFLDCGKLEYHREKHAETILDRCLGKNKMNCLKSGEVNTFNWLCCISSVSL